MEKKSKLSQLREKAEAGLWREAIAIAARFPQLGPQKDAILSAHGAYTNPSFYKQVGKDVEALKEAGKEALKQKYGI